MTMRPATGWAVAVRDRRGEWASAHIIGRTRQDAKKAWLDGIDPRIAANVWARDVKEGSIRLARIIITEDTTP